MCIEYFSPWSTWVKKSLGLFQWFSANGDFLHFTRHMDCCFPPRMEVSWVESGFSPIVLIPIFNGFSLQKPIEKGEKTIEKPFLLSNHRFLGTQKPWRNLTIFCMAPSCGTTRPVQRLVPIPGDFALGPCSLPGPDPGDPKETPEVRRVSPTAGWFIHVDDPWKMLKMDEN